MACGCSDSCNCVLIAGANISISASGNTYTISSIIPPETVFQAVAGTGIIITPGGTVGHSPTIEVDMCALVQDVDDASATKLLALSPDADCIPHTIAQGLEGQVLTTQADGSSAWSDPAGSGLVASDTDSVDLTLTGSVLTGDVLTDSADGGLSVTPAGVSVNRWQSTAPIAPPTVGDPCYSTIGVTTGNDLYAEATRVNTIPVGDGATISIPNTDIFQTSQTTADSINFDYTNTSSCSQLVQWHNRGLWRGHTDQLNLRTEFRGQHVMRSSIPDINGQSAFNVSGTIIGSHSTTRANYFTYWSTDGEMWVIVPSGATVTFNSNMVYDVVQNWRTTLSYQSRTDKLLIQNHA